MKKILIIGDIHIGKSKPLSSHPNIIRQANTQAKETLISSIPIFNQINPDLVVQMGDLIQDSQQKNIDQINLKDGINLLNKINSPIINLLGNHELRALSRREIEDIYSSVKADTNFFGLVDLGFLQVMWLDFQLNDDNNAIVSKERLDWIKEVVKSDKPLLVFSHYSLAPIDSKGSLYFQSNPKEMCYKNLSEIRDVFESLPAKIFVNAHVHLLTYKQEDNHHYISNPSFSENIAAQNFSENNPGVYSVLEIDEHKFVFTTYSGEFCFGKIEGRY